MTNAGYLAPTTRWRRRCFSVLHQHGWLLGTDHMLVSWNMASFGHSTRPRRAALSSIERFDAAGEVLLVVNALNALAGVAAAKGDFEAVSLAYESLLERCRVTGQHPYLPFCLVSLAGVRARQGNATAADAPLPRSDRLLLQPPSLGRRHGWPSGCRPSPRRPVAGERVARHRRRALPRR